MIPPLRRRLWVLALASTWAAGPASAQVTASVEAVGRDETDGSDVGWNSPYPTPSFDDDATRRGLPNAVWDGSHRLEPGPICLAARNLASPYPPMNTLSLGYRVRLAGAVFDDGASERTIEMHRFSGTPSPAPIERCLAIRSTGGTTATGPTVPVPSGIGPPGAGMSGPACHGLWGLGVQLGFAEHAATYDDRPAMLTQSLTYARDLAAQSGCLPTGEIEALRQRMASAPSSRPLFDSILALRQRYATIVQQECACGGGGGQAAHGVWGVGVQMGYAEYGAGRDASTATLTQSLDYALQLGTATQCLPLTEIQDLRGRMSSAPRSRPLYDAILAMRLRYATIVQQQCACGPAVATPPAQATCTPACGPGTACVSGTCVGGLAAARDPLAASRWRGEMRSQCSESALGGPTDTRDTVTIDTYRVSPTQVEVRLSGFIERTIVTTEPGGSSGSGHASEDSTQRDVPIPVRDGQIHILPDLRLDIESIRCRQTAVLAPAP